MASSQYLFAYMTGLSPYRGRNQGRWESGVGCVCGERLVDSDTPVWQNGGACTGSELGTSSLPAVH